jgi:hypothetical protein
MKSHHCYALQSVYLVGSLMVNDWWGVSFMGRYWGGGRGSLGAVIIRCVVYGIQLGRGGVVCGLVCSTSSGFSSGLFSLVLYFSYIHMRLYFALGELYCSCS